MCSSSFPSFAFSPHLASTGLNWPRPGLGWPRLASAGLCWLRLASGGLAGLGLASRGRGQPFIYNSRRFLISGLVGLAASLVKRFNSHTPLPPSRRAFCILPATGPANAQTVFLICFSCFHSFANVFLLISQFCLFAPLGLDWPQLASAVHKRLLEAFRWSRGGPQRVLI